MKVYEAVANAFLKETSVARGFGCRGRVARTLEEVAAGIDEFLAGDGPMVLDVRISRNVVAITCRRLHYGEDA
jgi:thiamine pyrophosphate-dependent acetolactate synthase large subunit-like protein